MLRDKIHVCAGKGHGVHVNFECSASPRAAEETAYLFHNGNSPFGYIRVFFFPETNGFGLYFLGLALLGSL